MIKFRVSSLTCAIGDQVASDIYSEYGALIVAKDTVINESIQNSLTNLKINHFWVSRTTWTNPAEGIDPKFDAFFENYKSSAKILEKVTGNLASDCNADVSELDIINRSIMSEITHNHYLVQFLCDIKSYDDATFEHSLKVAYYAALICKWLKFNEKKTENIIKCGLLHDVGKTKISSELLNKKEKLCSKEFDLIQRHAEDGFNMIKECVSLDPDVKLGVLFHHERVDGSGYPYRYDGKQLNVNAKIVAIADAYDALTSNRAYRSEYTPFMALNIFRTEGLTSYDVNTMNVFINNMISYLVGVNVLLSSGEVGKVIHIPVHSITRPIVSINSKLVDLSKVPGLSIVSVVKGNIAESQCK